MTIHQDWTIVFYIEENEVSPIDVFLSGLDARSKAKFDLAIEQLRIRNVTAHEPLVKHIRGKVYELRIESQTNIYRIMYFFYTGRRIVLLHGFQKKTQKTPNRDIAVAVKRKNHFVQREGGVSRKSV